MLLIIDNYDSFTWNLYQYFMELGTEVCVRRNDDITLAEISKLRPKQLVISPGPCTPNQAGISLEVIRCFSTKIPILGVCLGHQTIAQVFGAPVIPAKKVMHGKTSIIEHNNTGVFSGLNNPLTVTRYHSLIVEYLPKQFELTAWTIQNNKPDEIMGFRHLRLPVQGVQFHPESILSEQGHQLLSNFLNK